MEENLHWLSAHPAIGNVVQIPISVHIVKKWDFIFVGLRIHQSLADPGLGFHR